MTEGHEVYYFLLGASNFLLIIWIPCYKFCLTFEHLYITIPVQANMEPVPWYKSEYRTSILGVPFNKVWATIMSVSHKLCILSYNHGCSTFWELRYCLGTIILLTQGRPFASWDMYVSHSFTSIHQNINTGSCYTSKSTSICTNPSLWTYSTTSVNVQAHLLYFTYTIDL